MREQVEVLEHHADIDALAQHLALLQLVEKLTLPPIADELAVERDDAAVEPLEVVDRAQQRRLARARGADASRSREPDGRVSETSSSTLQLAEALGDAADGDLATATPGERCRSGRLGLAQPPLLWVGTVFRARRRSSGSKTDGRQMAQRAASVIALDLRLDDRERSQDDEVP